jgi:hypothetical protein
VTPQPKVRGAGRPRAQGSTSPQREAAVTRPRHRDVMLIGRGTLVTAAKRFARAAGAVYLLVVVVAAIVQGSVHAGIDVPGTANAGAQDSGAGSTLPAVTRDADVSMAAVSFLLVGVTLYLLFRHVDRRTAAAPVVYLAVGVGLLVVNLLFHHAALLAPSASSTGGLGAQSVNGLVSMLLDLSDRGYTVPGAALGLCLLPLGSMAYRSSRLPRVSRAGFDGGCYPPERIEVMAAPQNART